MKSQRGSVTVYATVTCLFVLIIGIASYVLLTNKQMAQAEMTNEIIQKYNDTTNLQEVYRNHVGGEIIPITSLDNFKKIGTGEQVYIDGKVYTFGTNSTYVIQADLQCDGTCAATITRIEANDIVVVGLYTITYNANGGTGTMDATIASSPEIATSTYTAPGNSRVFKEWNTAANGTGTSYAPGTRVSSDLTLYAIWNYTTQSVLSIGNEVSIKGEAFYVLENSSNTQETVTLLAKYNLDKNVDVTGKYYQKPNATYSETACAFSSTHYWDSYDGDLNTYTTDTVAGENSQDKSNNTIMRARDYAARTIGLGATGRLLTYEEANTLQSSYSSMINGTANTNEDGNYLYYWLAYPYELDNYSCVWCVSGNYGGLDTSDYYVDYYYGVRPVITVAKTLVQ